MKRRVDTHHPQSVGELEKVAKREWKKLMASKVEVQSVFASMPNRMQQLLVKEGGKIAY